MTLTLVGDQRGLADDTLLTPAERDTTLKQMNRESRLNCEIENPSEVL